MKIDAESPQQVRSWAYPPKTENRGSNRHLHVKVHSNSIDSSQRWKQPRCSSADELMNKTCSEEIPTPWNINAAVERNAILMHEVDERLPGAGGGRYVFEN